MQSGIRKGSFNRQAACPIIFSNIYPIGSLFVYYMILMIKQD